MLMHRKLIFVSIAASCVVSLTACDTKIKDVRVVSVRDADFKDEEQLEWVSVKPRPSIAISRVDFSTSTDLLSLARKHGYNVSFDVAPCGKHGMKQGFGPYGGVYWGKGEIYFGTKDAWVRGYADAIAKGPPFTYQVYVKKLPPNPATPICFTFMGGNMAGGKLRSNDAAIPLSTGGNFDAETP